MIKLINNNLKLNNLIKCYSSIPAPIEALDNQQSTSLTNNVQSPNSAIAAIFNEEEEPSTTKKVNKTRTIVEMPIYIVFPGQCILTQAILERLYDLLKAQNYNKDNIYNIKVILTHPNKRELFMEEKYSVILTDFIDLTNKYETSSKALNKFHHYARISGYISFIRNHLIGWTSTIQFTDNKYYLPSSIASKINKTLAVFINEFESGYTFNTSIDNKKLYSISPKAININTLFIDCESVIPINENQSIEEGFKVLISDAAAKRQALIKASEQAKALKQSQPKKTSKRVKSKAVPTLTSTPAPTPVPATTNSTLLNSDAATND